MRSASSRYSRLGYPQRQRTLSQPSSIELKLNKKSYLEGESISGTVFLKTREDYPECRLFLELEGKETLRLLISRILLKERSILQERACIYSCGILDSGRYVIPFRFSLPKDIPASFFQLSHYLFFCVNQIQIKSFFCYKK